MDITMRTLHKLNRLIPLLLFISSSGFASETLLEAAKTGNNRLVLERLLIEEDNVNYYNVNTSSNRRKTALHLAAEKGHLKVAQNLIHFGANVNGHDLQW